MVRLRELHGPPNRARIRRRTRRCRRHCLGYKHRSLRPCGWTIPIRREPPGTPGAGDSDSSARPRLLAIVASATQPARTGSQGCQPAPVWSGSSVPTKRTTGRSVRARSRRGRCGFWRWAARSTVLGGTPPAAWAQPAGRHDADPTKSVWRRPAAIERCAPARMRPPWGLGSAGSPAGKCTVVLSEVCHAPGTLRASTGFSTIRGRMKRSPAAGAPTPGAFQRAG